MTTICAPAIIYFIFSITQMLIDIYNGQYNTASVKAIVTVMVTLLLNILCEQGLGFVSWIIVFIPFILMTVIVSTILYVFGLDPSTGTIYQTNANIKFDNLGNIIIKDPEYNSNVNPVYYRYPNIIVPNPEKNNDSVKVPMGSSSPAYQS